ncbi:hypothetical protein [Streptomyces chrestomyceticus]|uniref:hypothetical protein n=1 Tax=Streptomyces chrestomyceticus TaxID=68185 RepID=UPI000F6227E2|nr:hypothetical protein [Streptomyces chrestomyceticus]
MEQLRSVAAHRLTLEVRDTRVINAPGRQRTPTTTWHVYRKPKWADGERALKKKLASLWVHFGCADIQQTIVLPGSSTDKAAARDVLARRTSELPDFDLQAHDVRLPIGPKVSDSSSTQTWWQKWGGAAVRVFLMLGLMIYGGLLQHSSGRWTVLGALPLLVAMWCAGEWITSNAHRPRIVRLAAGAVMVGAPVLLGCMWEAQESAGAHTLVSSIALGGGGWFIVRGCWFALRNSWVSRHLLGVLSSIVLPLAVAVPAFGYFLQLGYLNSGFGIPASAGTTEVFWQYAIALKPTGICLFFIATFVAIAGWLRHYHWIAFSRNWAMVMVPLVALLYVLTILTTGMSGVSVAAKAAARDAMNGKQPKPYFGIKGTLMCVTPVSGDASVYNGPLPKGRPVLTFGVSNGRLWLWDPERAKHPGGPKPTMHVQLFKVSTSVPSGNGRTCTALERSS